MDEIPDKDKKLIEAFFARFNKFLTRETEDCPYCGEPVTSCKQVGKAIYADPCGCRIGQGFVPQVWRE